MPAQRLEYQHLLAGIRLFFVVATVLLQSGVCIAVMFSAIVTVQPTPIRNGTYGAFSLFHS